MTRSMTASSKRASQCRIVPLLLALLAIWTLGALGVLIDKDYNVASEEEDGQRPESPSSGSLTAPLQHQSSSSLSSLATAQGRRPNCTRDTGIIDRLLNGTGYNKFRIPTDDGVHVSVELWIQAIESINEITNDFEMDIYINEMWLDPALNFELFNPCKDNLSLNHQVLERLWTPNSCFINSKIAEIHESPFRNVFLMLYPNGTVWVNYRVRVKGPCAMELSNFPMDVQTCNLIYESFNYNDQEVQMRWANDDPVRPMGDILLPDFDLIKIKTKRLNVPYPAGMWDELHVEITFERRYIWYFLQAYVPTFLTIFISWISFSLGPRAIPARTMLGVNALLAMIFQFGNIMRNLPRVSYVKAIDVWMLVAMTFIFLSLIELALVGYLVKDEGVARRKATLQPPIAHHHHHHAANNNNTSITGIGTLKKRINVDDFESSPRGIGSYERRFMLPMDPAAGVTGGGGGSTLGTGVSGTSQNGRGGGTSPFAAWRAALSPGRIIRLATPPAAAHFRWAPEHIDTISSFAFPTCFALFNIVYWSYYSQRKMAIVAPFI